jgi:hypothetical protein
MPGKVVAVKKLSTNEFYKITEDFILDIIALYTVKQDEIIDILGDEKNHEMLPDELIQKIIEVI